MKEFDTFSSSFKPFIQIKTCNGNTVFLNRIPGLLCYCILPIRHVLFSSNKQSCRIMGKFWSFPLLCPIASGWDLLYSIA